MSTSHEEKGFRPDPPDEDEEPWDNKELGASAEHVRKSSRKREDEVDEKLGLKMISIRLQAELIEKMKTLAEKDGRHGRTSQGPREKGEDRGEGSKDFKSNLEIEQNARWLADMLDVPFED